MRMLVIVLCAMIGLPSLATRAQIRQQFIDLLTSMPAKDQTAALVAVLDEMHTELKTKAPGEHYKYLLLKKQLDHCTPLIVKYDQALPAERWSIVI